MKRERWSRREFMKVGAVGALAPTFFLSRKGREKEALPLEYRTLGKTGLKITTVSLGCMVAPEAVIRKAVDLGINWLDTAYRYKGGRNEGEVARAVRGRRDKVYICTKVPRGSRKEMLENIDTSLKRLETDHVELLLLHATGHRDHVLDEDGREALRKAKKEGKTRFIGFSTHTAMAECLRAAIEDGGYDAALVKYSADPGVSTPELKSAIADAAKAGIGIIAMKTQIGSYKGPDGKLTPHQAALRWALEDENVTAAVPGTRNFRQLDENVAVMGTRLSYLDRRRLEIHLAGLGPLLCSGCGACAGSCTHGVAIPEVRRCAMYLDGYGDEPLARENYHGIDRNAAPCLECADCTARCVRGVPLRQALAETHLRLA